MSSRTSRCNLSSKAQVMALASSDAWLEQGVLIFGRHGAVESSCGRALLAPQTMVGSLLSGYRASPHRAADTPETFEVSTWAPHSTVGLRWCRVGDAIAM